MHMVAMSQCHNVILLETVVIEGIPKLAEIRRVDSQWILLVVIVDMNEILPCSRRGRDLRTNTSTDDSRLQEICKFDSCLTLSPSYII